MKSKSRKNMTENVQPIKNRAKLHEFEHELLIHGKMGRRNYTAFMISLKCLLRISDVLKLRSKQIYKPNGEIYQTIQTKDEKTKKFNVLYLNPLKTELNEYRRWRNEYYHTTWYFPSNMKPSKYMFPKRYSSKCYGAESAKRPKDVPMSRYAYYRAVRRTADYLGLRHVGAHVGRQSGAYLIYEQTGNLPLVQKMLNHTKTSTTLRYLGIDSPTEINVLNHIRW